MFNFKISRPSYDDLKSIVSINRKLFGEKCLSENYINSIYNEMFYDSKGGLLAAKLGNRMAGYAYVKEVCSLVKGHYAQIVDLVTLEYYRKNGADEFLLWELERWAFNMLCSEIRIIPDDKNKEDLLKKLKYIKDENSQVYRKPLYSFEIRKGRS